MTDEHFAVGRCRVRDTITLVDTLQGRGIRAWTPVYKVKVRLPRRRATRLELRPAMPSFVFVAYGEMEKALQLCAKGFAPGMTLFVFNRLVARVRGDQLKHLHDITEKHEEKASYPLGARVVVASGNFLGFSGTIVMWDGIYHTVQLDHKGFHLKLPPFLLVEDRR